MSLAPINFSLTSHLIEDEMITFFPLEILLKIFLCLEPNDLNRCCQVNREWNVLAKDDTLWKVMSSAIIFGAAQWRKYFGEVGTEPPLPPNIYKILQTPCPFWPDKKVTETQLLVLIPSTVNGKPLTLDVLEQLIQSPQGGGHATKYSCYYEEIQKKLGNQSILTSQWALITKDVIPNSRNKAYADQQALLKEPYAIPKILEIATGILMHYAQTGEKLYGHWTYTRCQETVHKEWHVAVGAFRSSGLRLNLDSSGLWYDAVGVSGIRKF